METPRKTEPVLRAKQPQVERLLELLGVYVTDIINGRVLYEATGGELTPSQLDALAFIHRHGKCSAKALSEGLRISIPSSTRLVDRLVRKGLAARREHETDRRLVELTTTPTGEAYLAKIRELRLERFSRALEPLHPDERDTLVALLERFVLTALNDPQMVGACCRHCGVEHDNACIVNEAHIALMGRPIEHP